MTEKFANNRRLGTTDRIGDRSTTNAASLSTYFRRPVPFCSACSVFVIWLLLSGLGPGVFASKSKTDKFEGTVVVVGPKAITVKSRHNIYLVRTFHYSAELERKMLRKKLDVGKRVTVHYVRGTDLALKVD